MRIMRDDGGVAMAVNCGGNDGATDDGNVIRSPSQTGPLHRAFKKHVFRPRGTAKPVLCVSKLLRVWWSVRGCVCAYLSTRPLCRIPPLFSRFVRSFDLDFARAVEVNWRCLL